MISGHAKRTDPTALDHLLTEPSPTGRSYTFGTFKNAQAQGDLEALPSYHRRTLRVHLGADAEQGLRTLLDALPEKL